MYHPDKIVVFCFAFDENVNMLKWQLIAVYHSLTKSFYNLLHYKKNL